MTIRAVVYARVSTKPQAGEDKVSIPDQLRECKKFIEKEGWQLAGEFVDPGISANIIERPGLTALFAALSQFDVLVAWDFDRFYRDRRSVAGYILDRLDEERKQITSLKQPIPIYDPIQYDPRENDTPYMLREMAGFTSGIDNRRRFRTLQKGIKDRFNQGYLLKPPPYGYRLDMKIEDGKVIKLPRQIVRAEAEIVRRIYREYLEGRSYHRIAVGLNAEGIPSRKEPYWSDNVVRRVLRNPTYCGKVYHYAKTIKGKKKELPEDQWTILPGKHEAIVSEELWQDAQMTRKRKQKNARAYGAPLMLSGLIRCGYCGYGMCKDGGWGGGYYICGSYKQTRRCRRNGYRRFHLEAEVKAYILDLLRHGDIFDAVTARQQTEYADALKAEVDQLEKTVAGFANRMSKLFDLYEKGDITREEFLNRRDEHQATEEHCRTILAQKKMLLDQAQELNISREFFETTLKDLDKHWDLCDPGELKQKLSCLIAKIELKDGQFAIRFRVGIETLPGAIPGIPVGAMESVGVN